jgi:hypothetical protein
MDGPVLILAREKACRGAGECTSRPLTKEEILKYYTKEEIERMRIKLEPPAREDLIKILAERKGKTNALYHAGKVFSASSTTIAKWMKQYGIEFDAEGRVITEAKAQEPEVKEEETSSGTGTDTGIDNQVANNFIEGQLQKMKSIVDESIKGQDTITITGQESTKLRSKLGYAEHDIGNATVIYDFRADLVKIVTPENGEMSLDVARAVAEDILDILDQ